MMLPTANPIIYGVSLPVSSIRAEMRTIKDVAEAARASTATVDRVLNNRPGVRDATRRRVLEAAAVMGYAHVSAHMAGLDVLLPTRPAIFMAQLAALLQKAGAELTTATGEAMGLRIHQIDYDQPDQVARFLRRIRLETSGIGIVMLDHLLIREALKEAIDHDVPVVTLLTDISSLPHQGFIGIDNRQAGRLAGYLIGRLAHREGGGDVAVFTGSPGYRGHEEREMGFRHIMRTEFPALRVLPTLETCEDPETAHRVMADVLRTHPELRAVYAVGAGSEGIAQALDEHEGVSRPVFVAHELSAATRPFVVSGIIDAVIDENPPALADRAVRRLIGAARHQMLGVCPAQDVRLITRENIPADTY